MPIRLPGCVTLAPAVSNCACDREPDARLFVELPTMSEINAIIDAAIRCSKGGARNPDQI